MRFTTLFPGCHLRKKTAIPPRLKALLLLFALFIAWSCGPLDNGEEKTTGDIIGTVTDQSSNPIAGAQVSSATVGKTTTSGSDGKFRLGGLTPGSYSVTASKAGFLEQASNITVVADADKEVTFRLVAEMPLLKVSPLHLDFGLSETTQSLQISNTGNSNLGWRVVENETWITAVLPDSGSASGGDQASTVTLTANRTNLTNGLINGFLTVYTSNDTFTVTSSIIKGAALFSSVNNLAFSSADSQKTFTLKNLVAGTLVYTITSTESWLSTTPANGSATTEGAIITVFVDRNSQPPGTRYGELHIASNGGNDTLTVAMNVTNPNAPQLFLPVNSLDLGSSVITYELPLTNTGNGILEWQLSENVTWLETGVQNGLVTSGETVPVLLTVLRAGLGTNGNPYQGEITFTSNDPTTPSVTLPVSMVVEDRPVLSISHPVIDFGLSGTSQSIVIGNAGTGILNWTATRGQNWITITPASGGNNTAAEVTINRSNTGFGNVSGYIDVVSNGGTQQMVILLENRNNNTAPVSDFTVTPVSGRLDVVFETDASITTDDYDPLRALEFRWRWEAGGVFSDWSNSPLASHQYGSTGSKQITLEARDTAGSARAKNRNITVVANAAPVANFTNTPPFGTTSDIFTFKAGGSTDDVDPVSALRFRWRFGSGTAFTPLTSDTLITHQFADNGTYQITLEVIDSDNATGTRTRSLNVSDNPAPNANFEFSPPSGTTVTVFQFDATSTTDDRDPIDSLLFRWKWEAAGAFTEWAHDTLASHQYMESGNKQVILEAKDLNDAIGTRTRNITVSANPAPNANFNFSPATGTTVTVFQFDAGITTDDHDPIEALLFRWQWEAAGPFTEWTNDTLASHQYMESGNKQVVLEAKDLNDAIGTRTRTVPVSANPAPNAQFSFSPPTGTPAMLFSFNAAATTDDTDPLDSLDFRWEFGAGNGFSDWTHNFMIDHQFATPGNMQVTLQARDIAGAVGSKTQNVPVVANQAPGATFVYSPLNGTITTVYQFDASATMDDFTPADSLLFRWRWTANSAFSEWANSPHAEHQFSTTGSKEVTLEVIDSESSVGSLSKTLQVVENQPPNALFTVDPQNGTIATLFQFDASGSTDDVTPLADLEFRWRWENGSGFTDWSDLPTAEHQYSSEGQKTVTLEVRDTGGLIGSVSNPVLVGSAPVTEIEPNDNRNQANPVGNNAVIFGEIGVAGDEDDWFSVTVPANGKLWYSIKNEEAPGSANSRIAESPLFAINELLDAVQLTTAGVNHGGSRYIGPGETAISNKAIVAENRTYYIQIPQFTGHAAQYTLTLFFSELFQSDLGEDNDSQVSAFLTTANDFHQAHVGFWKNGATTEDQQDWYKLIITESGVLQYTVENLHNETLANGFVDETVFYGATTFDFIELTRAGVSHGGNNRYIAPTEVATSGKVGIDVGREFFLNIPQYVNHGAPYEFQVNFVPSSYSDSGEDNDQSNSASPIDENSSKTALIGYVKGGAGQYDEKDWYKPVIASNGLWQFTIQNLYPGEITNGRIAPSTLYLKNVLDFIEIEKLQINHGGSNNYIGAGETVTGSRVAVSTAEEYFLEIPQYLTNRHQAPYILTTTYIAISITDNHEPNNDTLTAKDFGADSVLVSAIGYDDDPEDWFKFTAPQNGVLQFSVTNNHITGVKGGRIATSVLLNSALDIIATATINHGGSNNYIDAAETATSAVVPIIAGATYYIQVPRYNQDVAPYTLQTSFSQ